MHDGGTTLGMERMDHLSLFARRIIFFINSPFLESSKITKKREETFPSTPFFPSALSPPCPFFILAQVALPFK